MCAVFHLTFSTRTNLRLSGCEKHIGCHDSGKFKSRKRITHLQLVMLFDLIASGAFRLGIIFWSTLLSLLPWQ